MGKVLIFLVASILLPAAEDRSPASWHIEVVDPTGVGRSSSMKIDHDGNVHICYVVGDGVQLKYAFWDRTRKTWFNMIVDQGPNSCSLALDSKQRPHISYADYGTGEGARLRYAHWDGKAWLTQSIPVNSRIVSGYISIALNSSDCPTVAYYEYRGPRGTEYKIRLRTAMWNGKYWEVRTVDGEEGSGKVNNMTSDSRGNPHIAYANVAVGEMRYAYWDGKSWMTETVEGRARGQLEYAGLACAITVDKANNPHVTYLNTSTMQVKYGVRINGIWKTYAVDRIISGTENFDRNSIFVDDRGDVHIGYYDVSLGVLKLAHRRDQKWIIETVDGNGAGFTSSIQTDRGVMWVSYADEASMSLKVAHREMETETPGGPSQVQGTPTRNVAGAVRQ